MLEHFEEVGHAVEEPDEGDDGDDVSGEDGGEGDPGAQAHQVAYDAADEGAGTPEGEKYENPEAQGAEGFDDVFLALGGFTEAVDGVANEFSLDGTVVGADDEGVENEEEDEVLGGALDEQVNLAESVGHAVGDVDETANEEEFHDEPPALRVGDGLDYCPYYQCEYPNGAESPSDAADSGEGALLVRSQRRGAGFVR